MYGFKVRYDKQDVSIFKLIEVEEEFFDTVNEITLYAMKQALAEIPEGYLFGSLEFIYC